MIKGKTKSGINFEVDERITQDWRYQKKIAKLQKCIKIIEEHPDDLENATNVIQVLGEVEEIMFGGAEGAEAFESVVAQAHDGICSIEDFQHELIEIITTVSKKASSSQP